MLKKIRQNIIEQLWRDYCRSNAQVKQIETVFTAKQITFPLLDHFAIIDLPGPHTGITELTKIFNAIGYECRGKDYLPDKQNDFNWLAEINCHKTHAKDALPQIVIADFRLEELPFSVRNIINKYNQQSPASPAELIKPLASKAALGDQQAEEKLYRLFTRYFAGRDWPIPTVSEFKTVHECNELLAWVLVFGRRPNHFTYAIHHMPEFNSLTHFHHFVELELGIPLNQDGGVIKGNETVGIEQGSTVGTLQRIHLADGEVTLPSDFVEFVWRFTAKKNPLLWSDYFTGFIATHADRVIQSLFVPPQ
jgi:hypothetical protein